MELKQYLQSNNDYLPIKEFKIGTFLAEKYLAVKKEKIFSILKDNRLDLINLNKEDSTDLDYEDYIEKVQKSIENILLNMVSMTSGGGTTMAALADKLENGEIDFIQLVGMIASNPTIGSIDKAAERRIQTHVLHGIYSKDPNVINGVIELFKADIVFGNGWLPLVPKEVIEKFRKEGGIILNQHPGPLRKNGIDFGGKGMIGTRVIAARIIYLLETGATGNELFTESTIHIMTEKFDEGYSVGVKKLDIQFKIEEYRDIIKNLDNIEEKEELLKELISYIQQKLLVYEHENVAEVVSNIGKTKTIEKYSSYDEILVPEKNEGILEQSKQQAISLFPNG